MMEFPNNSIDVSGGSARVTLWSMQHGIRWTESMEFPTNSLHDGIPHQFCWQRKQGTGTGWSARHTL